MEYVSEVLAVLGSMSVSWGGIRYIIKPSLITRFCLTKYDAGASKIHDATWSACYIVVGFLLFLLSTLTGLFNVKFILPYLFIVLFFISVCGYILFFAPKKIIAREKACHRRILQESERN